MLTTNSFAGATPSPGRLNLFLEEHGVWLDPDEIVAVECIPYSLQTAPARVLVHLRGGQSVKLFFETASNDKAREAARFLADR